ncbi:MAG: HD domain-containing phosphohydrolase, partial [bacterium]
LKNIQSHMFAGTKNVTIDLPIFESMIYNADKLHKMVDDFLDFNKLEKGMVNLQCREIDINNFLIKIVIAISPSLSSKQLEIITKFPETPVLLYLDPWKIDKIFPNLLSNALKFTPKGGVITISIEEDEKEVNISIADNGIGIPEKDLPKIFERFYQVDGTQTRGYGGTGIGLNLTKSFVEMHRGKISVASEVNKGTKFTVTFLKGKDHLAEHEVYGERLNLEELEAMGRRKEDRRSDDRRQEERRYEGIQNIQLADMSSQMNKQKLMEDLLKEEKTEEQKERPIIQIVEDDPGIVQNLKSILQDKYRVRIAFNGEDGWDKILTNPPDLIISDIMMPKMDGYKLTEFIKTNPRTQHIPVIILTAKGEFEGKMRGLEEGAIDYLGKPVNPVELKARVSNHIALMERQRVKGQIDELKRSREEIIISFAESLAARDHETAGHCREVLEIGCGIAGEVGLPIDDDMRNSLLLHDIGKMGIPDSILLKEGKLTDAERALINTHPKLGQELVGHCKGFENVGQNIHAHQEWFNGKGYPQGLQGEDIPMVARIIAVADTYHVITHKRPYKEASTPKEAIKEIIKHKGTQFDPHLVDALTKWLIKMNIITEHDIDEIMGTI